MPLRDNPLCTRYCRLASIGKCGVQKYLELVNRREGRWVADGHAEIMLDATPEAKMKVCKWAQRNA